MTDQPIPAGFRLTVDPSVRLSGGSVVSGGVPLRALRLTPAGARAFAQLRTQPVTTPTQGLVARRLVDAGLAHPVPPPAANAVEDVTVVVPVLDRVPELDRCLGALAGRAAGVAVVVVDDGSADGDAVARVAERHGARHVRLSRTVGPGPARERGLAEVRTPFVAFLDSDCIAAAGWWVPLRAHLADPLVGAVAPRVVGRADRTWVGRYTAARGALDLGPQPALVRPGGRVAYVPTAALVARCAALRAVAVDGNVFDPALRYGEDVDLVWRLSAGRWRVLYVPDVQVTHAEPVTWRPVLARRFRYGTSAAPLAARHPDSTAPLVLTPGPTLTAAAVLTGRPLAGTAALAGTALAAARRRRGAGVTGGSVRAATHGAWVTGFGIGRWTTQIASPLLAAAVLSRHRRVRAAALALALTGPVADWWPRRRALDPLRFVLAHLADEIAYGAGVWAGVRRHRSLAAVRPRIVLRYAPARTAAPPVPPADRSRRPQIPHPRGVHR